MLIHVLFFKNLFHCIVYFLFDCSFLQLWYELYERFICSIKVRSDESGCHFRYLYTYMIHQNIWNTWLLSGNMSYIWARVRKRDRGRLAEPSLRYQPEPKYRLYLKTVSCILFILQHNVTFCATNELYSTNLDAYLQLKPWCNGVNEARNMTSKCIWTAVKCTGLYLCIGRI